MKTDETVKAGVWESTKILVVWLWRAVLVSGLFIGSLLIATNFWPEFISIFPPTEHWYNTGEWSTVTSLDNEVVRFERPVGSECDLRYEVTGSDPFTAKVNGVWSPSVQYPSTNGLVMLNMNSGVLTMANEWVNHAAYCKTGLWVSVWNSSPFLLMQIALWVEFALFAGVWMMTATFWLPKPKPTITE